MALSRYFERQPFTPLATFEVARPFDISGVTLKPGDIMPTDGLDVRLLRNLYDQRKIDVVDLAAERAARAPQAASKPAAPPKARASAMAADGQDAPRYRVKQAGFGGFKVLDEKGVPQGEGWRTDAEAQAEAARLNAL